MNNAEKYFNTQLKNKEFKQNLDAVSEQVDLEWELERVKSQIKNGEDKNLILKEIEKLQKFIHSSLFLTPSLRV